MRVCLRGLSDEFKTNSGEFETGLVRVRDAFATSSGRVYTCSGRARDEFQPRLGNQKQESNFCGRRRRRGASVAARVRVRSLRQPVRGHSSPL